MNMERFGDRKLLAAAAGAALAYYVDRKYLVYNDITKGLPGLLGLLKAKYLAKNNTLVPDLFEEAVRKYPNNICMMFEDRSMTFLEVDEAINRVSNWALRQGLQIGDKVALFMENRPEFVIVWMGLLKAGVISALINTHILADGLLHCIKIAEPKAVIVGVELLDKFTEVVPHLLGLSFHVYGDGKTLWIPNQSKYPFANSMDVHLNISTPISRQRLTDAHVRTTDMALLIYTSGTTGLPKAAKVNHFNIMMRSFIFNNCMSVTSKDRIYCSLPLYHTSGGNLAVGLMICTGATLCISRRFSTSRFWDEVRRYQCTIIQYIGEMCRYLMNTVPSVQDGENNIRFAFGNGLSSDVWSDFQSRFHIPSVCEFYGSTEGVMGLVNTCHTRENQGHLGKLGFLFQLVTGIHIVKYDIENEQHVRTSNGYLIECNTNEIGECIAKVVLDGKDPSKTFHGYYNNEKESSSKILRNVFQKGDAYVRTGDLFRKDHENKWYFVDRIGDTFRWKGENVSTNEVSQAISKFPGLQDICVYGVTVPGNEGRACMAAMVFDHETFDFKAFATHVEKRLPSYALPLFCRQLRQMAVTGTMKYEKAKLRQEGMDPSRMEDKLWFYNKELQTYERLTCENYQQLFTTARL